MFLLGVLPAVLTLWVRKAMPESAVWERVNDRRREAIEISRSGAPLQEQDQALRSSICSITRRRVGALLSPP
jgi:hypothetical protein